MTALLEIRDVSKRFRLADGRHLWALRHVHLALNRRETLGVVGESGSGKTTLGRVVMALERPTAGSILFEGTDITHLQRGQRRALRTSTQMVFQDPRDALDPRMRIFDSVVEPLRVAEPGLGRRELRVRVEEAADLAALRRSQLDRRPHQLSAGEQQRASLARAVIARPVFIALDEPTSMLDASLRAGMVRTFSNLQAALDVSLLLISHDFASIAGLCHRVAVMYLGEIVEFGPTQNVLRNPLHPYTQALLGAVPVVSLEQPPPAVVLGGEIPSPIDRPSGCPLVTRCPFATERCSNDQPPLTELEAGHHAACFVAADRLPRGEWQPVDTPGRWLAERLARIAEQAKSHESNTPSTRVAHTERSFNG